MKKHIKTFAALLALFSAIVMTVDIWLAAQEEERAIFYMLNSFVFACITAACLSISHE